MRLESTDKCPTCGERWVRERKVLDREIRPGVYGPSKVSWAVFCGSGHEFAVEAERVVDGSLRFVVVVPEPPERSPVRALIATGPCVGCGKPIQGGQLYVAEPVVRHYGCRGVVT